MKISATKPRDAAQPTKSRATLLLIHGKVWTGNPGQPEAEAIAIQQERILAVGESTDLRGLADSNTRVIDLRGRRAVPGFNDSHLHFYMGGASLSQIQLRSAKSAAEFRERLAKFAASVPKGEWIVGGNWDHQNWADPILPLHELIDDITPNHPIFLNRFEGHMALANSLAMQFAGISAATDDVPGGEIVRDAHRNPTGIFKDAARNLIEKFIPAPPEENILSAVLAAQDHAAQCGVTSVQDMGVLGWRRAETMRRVLQVYQRLEADKLLRVRISAHVPLPEHAQFSDLCGFSSRMLRIKAIKSFADGALGSSTAWLFEPYTDNPCSCGMPSDELADHEQMFGLMQEADRAGLQLAIHAIGDRANHTILNLFEKLQQNDGQKRRRLRIEHAQHLQAADVPRFAKLNVTASVQPYHCIDDGRWATGRIGTRRAKTTYAFRSLLDAGTVLAFGSDWFVAPLDPLQGIYAAVTRCPLGDIPPTAWVPEQKISVAEAVQAYTLGSAYASQDEHIKGSLEPGKLADIAVLSDDIFEIDPLQIRETKVDMTIFDGKVIYERS